MMAKYGRPVERTEWTIPRHRSIVEYAGVLCSIRNQEGWRDVAPGQHDREDLVTHGIS